MPYTALADHHSLPEAVRCTAAKMNELGSAGIPFLFVIDFLGQQPIVLPLSEVSPDYIRYNIGGLSNTGFSETAQSLRFFYKHPPNYEYYQRAFNIVHTHIKHGNTFLCNLTLPTPIETNLSLADIYQQARAPYKLWIRDRLVVFSPEIFVKINAGRISSHPMKGTINADVPQAERIIMADRKEHAEHATIVDLIRNDLSMVASGVHVPRFRYIDRVYTHQHTLLQVSSEIAGFLPPDYPAHIGSILFTMLPAGSISGAPKPKTLEIIAQAEGYERGYYTGIFGYFDGTNLDSAVLIRYIEQSSNGLLFKSGGGITIFSKPEEEYKELIDKVYVPIIREHQAV
jgi:para-aminobenzoate synthetase component 1